jgi:hypothetical protein
MPELPWQGHYLRVDADRRATWIRCVICHRGLTLPASIERGCGADCLAFHTPAELDDARERARKEDRYLWRMEDGLDLPASRFQMALRSRKQLARVAERQAAEQKRTGNPDPILTVALQRLYDQDPDAAARWQVFQAAKRRRAAS